MAWKIAEEPKPADTGLLRTGAGLLAKGVQAIGDLPADIVEGVRTLANMNPARKYLNEKIPGISPEIPEIPIPRVGTAIKETVAEQLPKGYLEPQGDWEQFAHNVIGDVIPLAVSGVGAKRAVIASGLGNAGSWLAKQFGYGEGVQSAAKMGTMLAATMTGTTKLNEYKKKLYVDAKEALPEGATMPAHGIKKYIDELEKEISYGDDTKPKIFMRERINKIRSKITPEDTIPVRDVWQLKKDMNTWLRDPDKLEDIEELVGPLGQHLKQELIKWGKPNNKPFLDAFLAADDIHAGINEGTALNKFLQRNVNEKTIGYMTGATLLGGHSMEKAAKGIGAALATRYGVQAYEALKNSSEIRKYYENILIQSAKKNVPGLLREVSKFDRAMTNKYPENRRDSNSAGWRIVSQ